MPNQIVPPPASRGSEVLSAPVIPDPSDLYDQIMQPIEPELTRAGLQTLSIKYKGEKPQEAAARADRYNKAFAEYDKRFAAYMTELNGKVVSYQHAARTSTETKDRADEEQELSTLQTQMASM